MTEIRPFRGLRYDPKRVELSRVLVPPYDVIAPDERAGFFGRDPHNAIRLELTRDPSEEAGTDYAEVRRTLDAWRAEGVLVQDPRPALYGLRQRFTAPDGGRLTREGFFALLHLEDYARRVVRPHERTLAGPKADRLKLLRAARANLSIVFLLYEDREQALARALAPAFAAGPDAEGVDAGGVEHALTRIDDVGLHQAVSEFMRERPVVIADGHHRYETALTYRDERRRAGPPDPEAPFEWTLAYFANAYAPGSLLLPIHRLLVGRPAPPAEAWSRLVGWSERRVVAGGAEAIPGLLARELAPLAPAPAFALDDGSGSLRIFSRAPAPDGELAIRVFHREVVQGALGLDEAAIREGALDFPKDTLRAARDVRAGRGSLAFYLNALSPDDVFRVTAAGEVLPQKSTFFLPKLPTGLVFRLLEETP